MSSYEPDLMILPLVFFFLSFFIFNFFLGFFFFFFFFFGIFLRRPFFIPNFIASTKCSVSPLEWEGGKDV